MVGAGEPSFSSFLGELSFFLGESFSFLTGELSSLFRMGELSFLGTGDPSFLLRGTPGDGEPSFLTGETSFVGGTGDGSRAKL